MSEKISRGVIEYTNGVYIQGFAAAGSKTEGEGPLGKMFDKIYDNPIMNEDSWEKAESVLQKTALTKALEKSGTRDNDLDAIFAGDLLNQCTASSFGLSDFNAPYIGMYGACSTMALTLLTASQFIDSGAVKTAAAVTSSHFCTAERQYRYPLEYGGQRPPTAQWTATASGALVLSSEPSKIRIRRSAVGIIKDLGVKDQNNMGAAMAPAAASTIIRFLSDTNTKPENYDCIFTGDLGKVGSDLLYSLCTEENVDLKKYHQDCGLILFDREKQDVHAGGSGCGCSASVLCTYILNKFMNGEYKNVIFCATGALLSPTTVAQKETVPSVAHLINIVKAD